MPNQGFGQLFGGLLRPVGNGRDNRQEDVLGVKRAMRTLGRYAEPGYGMTGYIDQPLDRTIRNYQADRGIRVDGYLNPGGETERELDTNLTLLGGLRKGIGEAVDLVEDLGKRAATGLAEGRMRARKGLFDLAAGTGRLVGLGDLGFDRASEHLGRYLSGRGGTRTLSSAEVEREPALTNAERANRILSKPRRSGPLQATRPSTSCFAVCRAASQSSSLMISRPRQVCWISRGVLAPISPSAAPACAPRAILPRGAGAI
jgi:hypothetical protein